MSNSDDPTPFRRRAPIPAAICPMAQAAEILGDRWTLLILREAFYGVLRYADILADTGAPRAMLTDRLNKLVAAGILERRPYQEKGARLRHAYGLTAKGMALAHVMMAMAEWGEDHVTGKEAPVALVDHRSGHGLRLAFVDPEGTIVARDHARLRRRDASQD